MCKMLSEKLGWGGGDLEKKNNKKNFVSFQVWECVAT